MHWIFPRKNKKHLKINQNRACMYRIKPDKANEWPLMSTPINKAILIIAHFLLPQSARYLPCFSSFLVSIPSSIRPLFSPLSLHQFHCSPFSKRVSILNHNHAEVVMSLPHVSAACSYRSHPPTLTTCCHLLTSLSKRSTCSSKLYQLEKENGRKRMVFQIGVYTNIRKVK